MVALLPVYYQIKQTIKNWIINKEFNPGAKIPSENELAEKFQVSRLTVRQAISQLIQEGLLISKRGEGTFVTNNENLINSYGIEFIGFMDDLFHQVSKSKTKSVRITHIEAPKLIKEKLRLSEEEKVVQINARFKMYPLISLNHVTIRQAPFAERIAITREAGFSGIELWMDEVREYARDHGGLDSVLGLLRQNRLRFDQSLLLRECFSPSHVNEKDKFLKYAEGIFKETKYLGGKIVLACSTFGPADLREAPKLFAELCDLANPFGVQLALEFIGWAETIKDIRTAVHIVEKASRKNGGILYDTFHHYFGGSSSKDLEELPLEYLFAVHIVDAKAMNLHTMEISRKYRLFPGKGEIPIPEMLRILFDKKYRSFFTLEIFSEEYWKRPASEVAREGFESMVRVLSEAGYDR